MAMSHQDKEIICDIKDQHQSNIRTETGKETRQKIPENTQLVPVTELRILPLAATYLNDILFHIIYYPEDISSIAVYITVEGIYFG